MVTANKFNVLYRIQDILYDLDLADMTTSKQDHDFFDRHDMFTYE